MSELFFEAISDDVINENLKLQEGEEITYRFADTVGRTHVTIFFTNQNRAAWIVKYKKEYYGNILNNIERQDEYTYIDIYKTLRDNAAQTLKAL